MSTDIQYIEMMERLGKAYKNLVGIKTPVIESNISNALLLFSENIQKTTSPILKIYSKEDYAQIIKNAQILSDKIKETIFGTADFQVNEEKLRNALSKSMSELIKPFDITKGYGEVIQNINQDGLEQILEDNELLYDEQEEVLTAEQDEEVVRCLQEDIQNGNTKGFQEKVYDWTQKQKKKYYVFYIIIGIWFSIFILPYLQENVGLQATTKVVSKIRELPDIASEIIDSIGENIRCEISGNVPYWVKVAWQENGEEKSGWIAKRNIVYINENEEEKDMSEMNLFRKTDTTLVYTASEEFAKRLMKNQYNKNVELYIHVGRDKGSVFVYEDNNVKKSVQIGLEERAIILKRAESDR